MPIFPLAILNICNFSSNDEKNFTKRDIDTQNNVEELEKQKDDNEDFGKELELKMRALLEAVDEDIATNKKNLQPSQNATINKRSSDSCEDQNSPPDLRSQPLPENGLPKTPKDKALHIYNKNIATERKLDINDEDYSAKENFEQSAAEETQRMLLSAAMRGYIPTYNDATATFNAILASKRRSATKDKLSSYDGPLRRMFGSNTRRFLYDKPLRRIALPENYPFDSTVRYSPSKSHSHNRRGGISQRLLATKRNSATGLKTCGNGSPKNAIVQSNNARGLERILLSPTYDKVSKFQDGIAIRTLVNDGSNTVDNKPLSFDKKELLNKIKDGKTCIFSDPEAVKKKLLDRESADLKSINDDQSPAKSNSFRANVDENTGKAPLGLLFI